MALSRDVNRIGQSIARALSPDQEPQKMADNTPATTGQLGYEEFRRVHDAGRDFPSPAWANVPPLVRSSWEAAAALLQSLPVVAPVAPAQADPDATPSVPQSDPQSPATPTPEK